MHVRIPANFGLGFSLAVVAGLAASFALGRNGVMVSTIFAPADAGAVGTVAASFGSPRDVVAQSDRHPTILLLSAGVSKAGSDLPSAFLDPAPVSRSGS